MMSSKLRIRKYPAHLFPYTQKNSWRSQARQTQALLAPANIRPTVGLSC